MIEEGTLSESIRNRNLKSEIARLEDLNRILTNHKIHLEATNSNLKSAKDRLWAVN